MDALVLPIVRLANLVTLFTSPLCFPLSSFPPFFLSPSTLTCTFQANLLICATLIGTGTIQFNNNIYHYSIDKWHQTDSIINVPSFTTVNVDWQYVSLSIVVICSVQLCAMLVMRLASIQVAQRIAVASAFISAPAMLVVFYWEMHYGRCPWLDEYRLASVSPEDSKPICTATAWTVAGILSVISCCLFLIDGLLSVNMNHNIQRRMSVGYVDPVVRIYDSLQY
uniref:Uncharacterized protein n=1 Tax=Plectus sambesii TaxID=2011161 RepID=A0A914WLG7_9BILA